VRALAESPCKSKLEGDHDARYSRWMADPLIRTLTLNPSIDLSSDVDELQPTHKLRTRNERMDAGGGGINVARVLRRLEANVEALFLAGGVTGALLDDLLRRDGVERQRIAIAGDTRLSHTIHECSTGKEYRFVPEGPPVADAELARALEAAAQPCDYLVASGSLPPSADAGTYARLAAGVTGSGTQLVLDTSGAELAAAMEAGGIFLVKPSRGELEELAGENLADAAAIVRYASQLVKDGKAKHVAVTLARDGAILVSEEGAFELPAVQVETRSAVGAGDSFVAAMTFGLATGRSLLDAFRLGAAAGAAAALTPGTGLCRPEDVWRLLDQIERPIRLG